MNPNLIIVGSVGIDDIETPASKRENLLGGSASYACATASFYAPVGMVGVVGSDFPAENRDTFDHFGIDLAGLQVEEGTTFRWAGKYHENMDNRDTLLTELGVFEAFNPELPADYKDVDFLFLGNIHPALQRSVLDQVNNPKFVLLDTMNLWIDIAKDDLTEVISRVHMLTLNESEARLYTGKHNLVDAAHALLELGPAHVLVKKGASGAMLIGKDGSNVLIHAFPLKEVIDPTGAGDSFAGGFMGSLTDAGEVTNETLRTAMLRGTVAASFGVQSFSLDMYRDLARADLDKRDEELKEMVRLP